MTPNYYIPLKTYAQNWALDVSRGIIPKTTTITKFGYNADVDAAAPEDIFGQGGTYVPPTTARIHSFASSSASDAAAGAGARTMLMRGVDASFNAINETITLNGVTPVLTANSYIHIHLCQVLTVGSTGSNVGTITGTAQTDATVTITVEPLYNQSNSSIFFVPVGFKGYIMKFRARISNATANSNSNVALLVQPFGGGYQVKTIIGVNNSGSSSVENDYTNSTPFIVQAKSFVKIRALLVGNNNTEIFGEYDLILVQD